MFLIKIKRLRYFLQCMNKKTCITLLKKPKIIINYNIIKGGVDIVD